MKFGGRIWLVIAGLSLLAPWARSEDGPKTVVVTSAARLEIQRAGKTTGTVGVPAGTTLEVVAVEEDWVRVKFRSLEGRVAAAKTDLQQQVEAAQAKVAAAEAAALEKEMQQQMKALPQKKGKAAPPAAAAKAAPTAAAAENVPPPPSVIGRLLAGKLVQAEGSGLRPVAADRLGRVKFYAIYFSAGWCPPCREFTPGFVDAYRKIREVYPEFETVFVSNDKSPAEMAAYMRDDRMTWPAVRWDAIQGLKEITRYAGSGIPCLVLIDADGKVLSDSYRWGRYVGPDAVLEDTWKLLKDYRRKNPRVKA